MEAVHSVHYTVCGHVVEPTLEKLRLEVPARVAAAQGPCSLVCQSVDLVQVLVHSVGGAMHAHGQRTGK